MDTMNDILPFQITNDITLIVEKAENFGSGIAEAFVRLAEKIGHQGVKRDCYGIIIQVNNEMNYFAGYSELHDNEASEKGLPISIIPAGNYQSILIENWNQNLLKIGPTFDQIVRSNKVDRTSPFIEFYQTEQKLICMIQSK
jgi:hypothetical protein